MKRSFLVNVLALSLILALGGTGCKHGKQGITPIPPNRVTPTNPNPIGPTRSGPGTGVPIPSDIGPGTRNINETNLTGTTNGIPQSPNLEDLDKFNQNRDVFQANTVHFDFDRSEVKASERPNIEAVAEFMKKSPADSTFLLVEGHCDERGTEEYNRALGERRALAVREYLVNLGVSASRVRTISYGKDKPVDPAHNDAAWEKNRRAEFVLLTPKQ